MTGRSEFYNPAFLIILRMSFRIAPIFVLLSILAGCAAPQAEILSKTDNFPPTANVEILLDRPARPHKTFAILEDSYGGDPGGNQRPSREQGPGNRGGRHCYRQYQ